MLPAPPENSICQKTKARRKELGLSRLDGQHQPFACERERISRPLRTVHVWYDLFINDFSKDSFTAPRKDDFIMALPRMKIADLDVDSLDRLTDMEDAYGATIVAVQPVYSVSKLSADQMEKVQALEDELDVVLIAYEN
jgi:hypothetical protein